MDARSKLNRRFVPIYYLVMIGGWVNAIVDESATKRPGLWTFTILVLLIHGISLHAADRLHPIEDVRLWWMTRGR